MEKARGDGALINGGFFVLSPKVLNEVKGNSRPGRGNRCSGCRPGANSWPMNTTASGSRWTRCARRTCSRQNGPLARRAGRSGRDASEARSCVLARSPSARDRPYRFQGSVAVLLARAHGGWRRRARPARQTPIRTSSPRPRSLHGSSPSTSTSAISRQRAVRSPERSRRSCFTLRPSPSSSAATRSRSKRSRPTSSAPPMC